MLTDYWLSIRPQETYLNEISLGNKKFSFTKMRLKTCSAKWWLLCLGLSVLTHWGRVTHMCVSELTIIGSDNGLSPGRCQAIIWTNAGILLIGLLGTRFSGILIGIQTFSFKKMHLNMSSAKWRPFCLGLSVITMSHGVAHSSLPLCSRLSGSPTQEVPDHKSSSLQIRERSPGPHWRSVCLAGISLRPTKRPAEE